MTVKRANAICEHAREEQAKGFKEFATKGQHPASTSAGLEELVLDVALPPVQAAAEQLGDLPAPAGDEEQLAAIASGFEDAVGEAEEDPLALARGTGKNPFEAVGKMAKAYGIRTCAELT